MTNVIKNCKGEEKRGVRSAESFRRKLFIPDHEIYESIENKKNVCKRRNNYRIFCEK